MCGIAGYINFKNNLIKNKEKHKSITKNMTDALYNSGSAETKIGDHAAFGSLNNENQPMERVVAGYQFVITYDGEIYNAAELKKELTAFGYNFTTKSDTEILLYSYIHYGTECAEKLEGSFSFCIWDSMRQRAFLCRDSFGIKPLFYSLRGDYIIFASERKAFFKYPDFKAEISLDGLCDIFALCASGAHGGGIFEGISELGAGCYMICSRAGIKVKKYFSLKADKHTDSYNETLQNIRYLIYDSAERQIPSDTASAAFLSGKADNDIICVALKNRIKNHEKDFSVYHIGDCNSDNTYPGCTGSNYLKYIYECVYKSDCPSAEDDFTFWKLFGKMNNTAVISTAFADEIFSYDNRIKDEKTLKKYFFSQFKNLKPIKNILLPEVEKTLKLDEYLLMKYEQTASQTPQNEEDLAEDKIRRKHFWLNMNLFMSNQLERKANQAKPCQIRFPLFDSRLIQYAYNIPCNMRDNILGAAFKEAADFKENKLSEKSNYERLAGEMLLDIISNRNEPIVALCDYKKIENACINGYNSFFGFLLQVNEWLKHYSIKIV